MSAFIDYRDVLNWTYGYTKDHRNPFISYSTQICVLTVLYFTYQWHMVN